MFAKSFFYASVLVLILVAGKWVKEHPYFRIAKISIVAEDGGTPARADTQRIFEAVRPALTGSFFAVDVHSARKAAQAQPWVKQARIDRIAPDGIRITVSEHEAAARWIREGYEAGLIAPDGTVFQAAHPDRLPELDGGYGSHVMMLEQWRIFSAKLKPLRLGVKRLQYSPRAAWTLYLDNGLEVRLGKDNLHARLDRFTQLYRAVLAERADEAEYADMRYEGAAAVGWREGAKPAASEPAAPSPQ